MTQSEGMACLSTHHTLRDGMVSRPVRDLGYSVEHIARDVPTTDIQIHNLW
jgi:hypothetical protein